MREYHKIQSIFKRDTKTHKFLEREFSLPEFEYLKDNQWRFTEKIDGTNIRIMWDGGSVRFGGRTDNAQIPSFLFEKLQDLFPPERFKSTYPDTAICLYGEGYGAKIQKGGGNYIPNGVSFILFDIRIGEWWMNADGIWDIAFRLGIKTVPEIGNGTLEEGIQRIKNGLKSVFGNFLSEGLVAKPLVELQNRNGHRIITKMKHRDF